MNVKYFYLILFAGVIFFFACQKEKISDADREKGMQTSKDYLEASQTFSSLFTTMDREAKQQSKLNGFQGESPGSKTRNGCPEVTLVTNGNEIFPATLTLNYGEGCTTIDNKPAAGKVSIVFTGLLLKGGTSISMDFENFEHNDYQVSGTYQISNDGEDVDGLLTFTARVTNGVLIDPQGKTIRHDGTSVRKFIEGFDTNFFTDGIAGITDDVWSVTEMASGITREGITYQLGTNDPLRAEVGCKWPVSGALSLDLIEPAIESSIDFGTGDCDNKAILQINDYTTEIEL